MPPHASLLGEVVAADSAVVSPLLKVLDYRPLDRLLPNHDAVALHALQDLPVHVHGPGVQFNRHYELWA